MTQPHFEESKPQLGAHTHLFRGSPAEVAAAMRELKLTCVQLTPAFPGLSFHHPGQITAERAQRVAEPFLAHGPRIACLTGTTNLLDPNLDRRHQGIIRLHTLLRHCRSFGTNRIVTETGSLTRRSPYRPFSQNRSPEAWQELVLILQEALRIAAANGVQLLLKPEPAHVVATAEDALRLLEEVPSPYLGFVMDPAIFLVEQPAADWNMELARLVDQLADRTPLIHAKDLRPTAEGIAVPRVGRGLLDYGLFLKLMSDRHPGVPVILEHVRREEIAECRAYLLGRWMESFYGK